MNHKNDLELESNHGCFTVFVNKQQQKPSNVHFKTVNLSTEDFRAGKLLCMIL